MEHQSLLEPARVWSSHQCAVCAPRRTRRHGVPVALRSRRVRCAAAMYWKSLRLKKWRPLPLTRGCEVCRRVVGGPGLRSGNVHRQRHSSSADTESYVGFVGAHTARVSHKVTHMSGGTGDHMSGVNITHHVYITDPVCVISLYDAGIMDFNHGSMKIIRRA